MAGKKVLYVDDEHVNLFLFERMFDEEFNLICANSASEALEVIEKDPDIAVVFSDMNMPSMNGLEFIAQAKTAHEDIAYLIITGYMIDQEMKKALKNGLIIECIQKPFDKKGIVSIVKQLIKEN